MLAKIKKGALQLFGGLLMEKKASVWTVSLGRVAFWTVFLHCIYVWSQVQKVGEILVQRDVSEGELYALFALLGYGGVKIGTNMVTSAAKVWKNGAAGSPPSELPTPPGK